MKVKFLTRSAGPKGVIHPGEMLEVPDSEAELLIKGGYAEAADAPQKPKDDVKATKKQKEESKPEKKAEEAQAGGEE